MKFFMDFRRFKKKLKKGAKCILHMKKRILGNGNRLEIKTCNFRKINFLVDGEENSVFISEKTAIMNTKFLIEGNNNRITIGRECDVRNSEFKIHGDGCEIAIGSKNEIASGPAVFCASGNGAKIKIGSGNQFAWGNLNLTAEGETILSVGDGCLFSHDVFVRTGDSHSILDKETGERLNVERSISIGDRVWIAPFVRILKGASIKNDSVVGTGSIVTHPCSAGNVVIAGNPAKMVKENIVWKR